MSLHNNLNSFLHYCMGSKIRSQYICKDVSDPHNISDSQKNSARKAILWLLSKASHSVEEIADHFDISYLLVSYLLEELVKEGYIEKELGCPVRFKYEGKKD